MKQFFESFKKLSFGAKLRFIFQILVYINQVMLVFANTPLSDNMVYQTVSLILTILITALTYWFNNDWTGAAKMSKKVLDIMKDGKVTHDEVQVFIDEHKDVKVHKE